MPLILFVGAALDYSYAARNKTLVQNAIDGATLSATTTAQQYLAQNPYDPNAVANAITAGKSAGQGSFAAILSRYQLGSTLDLDMNYANSKFTANATGRAVYTTSFMKMVGILSLDISAAAQATSTTPSFIAVNLLLDVSQSMGLAATSDDMLNLSNATKTITGEACAFGCHVSLYPGKPSNSTIAKSLNIKLRIDALRSAVLGLLQDAQNGGSGSYYRFSISTMDTNLTKLANLTNNYPYLNTVATSLDLGPTDSGGPGASFQPNALQSLLSSIPSTGTGQNSSQEIQYLIIVTDGVYDKPGSCTFGHCTGFIDSSYCAPYKSKGVKVAVIYTTYLPVYNDPSKPSSGFRPEYSGLVLPFANSIAPALQACASSGLYFEASDGPAIDAAFKSIFSATRQTSIGK